MEGQFIVFIIISSPVLGYWVRKRKRLLSQPNYQSQSIDCLNLLSYAVNIQLLISNQLVPRVQKLMGLFVFFTSTTILIFHDPISVYKPLYDNSPNRNLCNVITGGQILCIIPKPTSFCLTGNRSFSNWYTNLEWDIKIFQVCLNPCYT